MIMAFLVLLFAHLLADYPLQGDFLANMKGKNKIVLVTHAAIWTGTISVAFFLLGFTVTIPMILSLFIVHAIADHMKAAKVGFYKKLDPLGAGLAIDQLIHVGQILSLLIFFT